MGAKIETKVLPINHTYPMAIFDGDCKKLTNKYSDCKRDKNCNYTTWDVSKELQILCHYDTTRMMLNYLYGSIKDPEK